MAARIFIYFLFAFLTTANVEKYILGDLGKTCSRESSVIRNEPECHKAVSELSLIIKGSLWTGNNAHIPSGCSMRPGSKLHFEKTASGVGKGRDDLRPICKKKRPMIEIKKATYGSNCNGSDQTEKLKNSCKRSYYCSYRIVPQLIGGDPCPRIKKIYKVLYKCGDTYHTVQTADGQDAAEKTITLECSNQSVAPDVALSNDGAHVLADIGEAAFNTKFAACKVVKYVRNGITHSVYQRITPVGDFNAYNAFTHTWRTRKNKLHVDFEIYNSVADLEAGRGKWKYCNANDGDVGYPRDCGKFQLERNQWFSMPGDKFNARGLTKGASFKIFDAQDCPKQALTTLGARQNGFCVKDNGKDQNSGVDKADGSNDWKENECVDWCRVQDGITGCEYIWNQGNKGCYKHTKTIARGNGKGNHYCWLAVDTYILGDLGKTCSHESSVIRNKPECYKAASELSLDIRDSWSRKYAYIPSGCSIRPADGKLHFEKSNEGVGKGRDDLKPICKMICSEAIERASRSVTRFDWRDCGGSGGSIPDEIGELTALTYLNLRHIGLTGTVPSDIQFLTALTWLYLNNNHLTTIPSEISKLTGLRYLNLMHNPLTTIPQEISQLTALQILYLNHNRLTAIPQKISQLAALRYLNLSGNRFTTIPGEISQLTKLQILYLKTNQLTAIPQEISQLAALQYLNLNHNRLTTIPQELSQLPTLQILNVNNNHFSTIPQVIYQLTTLLFLNLSDNRITEILQNISQLTKLQYLNLSNNQLTVIPKQISQLTALQYLYLGKNNFDCLPSTVNAMSLENNDFEGKFPDCID